MNELRSWIVVGRRALHYELYRLGLASCPSFMDVYDDVMVVMGRCLKWDKRLRVLGAEHCPKSGPAIFAANHVTKVDSFNIFRAIYLASDGNIYPRTMMRDDFFERSAFKSRLLDLDEVSRLFGAIQISRDRVRLSQLKPFLKLLQEGGSFVIYPGRTRTRTGTFVEYRDAIDEPGATSFLIAQAQRRDPSLRVPIVPMAQTFHPLTKGSAVVFGPPLYLPRGADRRRQRELDFHLMTAMAELVEINVPQVLSALVLLRCMHGLTGTIERAALQDDVASVLAGIRNRHVDPAAQGDLEGLVARILAFLRQKGMVETPGRGVALNVAKILDAPPHDMAYKQKNPIKYLANQILHLPDVVAAIEQAVPSG